MGQHPLRPEQLIEAVELVARYKARGYRTDLAPSQDPGDSRSVYGVIQNVHGIVRETLRHRVKEAERRLGLTPDDILEAAIAKDDDRPCPLELLDHHAKVNLQYIARRRVKPVVIPVRREPFAVGFVGDPHLTNAGCNLSALRADLTLLKMAGVRSIQMGDILDNFHRNGKLAPKEAQNRMSIKEGLSLAKWMIAECGVKWDAHVLGNHDLWLAEEGVALLGEWVKQGKSRLFDWNAHLIYRWGDTESEMHRVHAAHDFKGSSIYNPLHGNARMALFDGSADTYVAAHRHNHADSKLPNGWRKKTYQLIRVRGYKDYDSYSAGRAQFPDHDGMEGRSALLAINPLATTHDGRQRVFMDLADGLEYLEAIKRREAA